MKEIGSLSHRDRKMGGKKHDEQDCLRFYPPPSLVQDGRELQNGVTMSAMVFFILSPGSFFPLP